MAISMLIAGVIAHAQTTVKGKIIDATSREPINGATIRCEMKDCTCGCITNNSGDFELKCTDCRNLTVSYIGYASQIIPVAGDAGIIALSYAPSSLQEVVLSANRGEKTNRTEAPMALTNINAKLLSDSKPTTLDQVLNKVSGVNMVNLGNEQHQMSIRQPMTTKSLFLYLEDGIPVRTTGLFNHNALLEINSAATKNIEVIKGPSSSLYGSEAIGGVVNFITLAPTAIPILKLSIQGNNNGYRRGELVSSLNNKKWGAVLTGYIGLRRNGFLDYSDFTKKTATLRFDYRFSSKTVLSNKLTYLEYESDMSGGIDSMMFANKTFSSLHSFTFRNVSALRYNSTLSHQWSDDSRTTITALVRGNEIRQNPAYRVKDDYRKVNGMFVGQKDLAHGEINSSKFKSYSLIAQHSQKLKWKKSLLTGGLNIDLSPSTYSANYIRIKRDSVSRRYLSFSQTDSSLTDYNTQLNNYAAFASFEINILPALKVVASLRYDFFKYKFENNLKPSSFSGSPDTTNFFGRMSPKIGATYTFSNAIKIYSNYSEGFVPPQVTELYTGVKVPELSPSVFRNIEIGGWLDIIRGKLSMDFSVFLLNGYNEIVSVKADDGSFRNANAGATRHTGTEFGINATPFQSLSFRFSGSLSKHEFLSYEEKGIKYDGLEMNNAPRCLLNSEIWFRPEIIKGFRLGAELQYVGKYFMDPLNSTQYSGYTVLNLRTGFRHKGIEFWINYMNVTNRYYANIASKSSFGYSYNVAEPANINLGISYDFASISKKKK